MRRLHPVMLLALPCAAGALVVLSPLYAAGALAAFLVLVLASVSMDKASVLLLMVAVLTMRPFLFGERFGPVSVVCACGAAFFSFGNASTKADRASKELLGWTCLLWAYLFFLYRLHQAWFSASDTYKGIVDVPLVLGAAMLVCRDAERRRLIIRALARLNLLLCASAIVTYAIWRVTSNYHAGFLANIPAGYKAAPDGTPLSGLPVYAPFTPTYSTQTFGGVAIPRFAGLGRESGIGAALLVWCLLMLPRVGLNRKRNYALLLAGIALTQSTGGFAVLLIAVVVDRMLISRRKGPLTPERFIGQVIGLGMLVAAGWVAYHAPTFGIQAKTGIDKLSLDQRAAATSAGWHSLLHNPLGQFVPEGTLNAGINIVAAITVYGAIGFLLTLLVILRPLQLSQVRSVAVGPVLAVLLTVLTAQPFIQSAGFYLLILLAVASSGQTAQEEPEDVGVGHSDRVASAAHAEVM